MCLPLLRRNHTDWRRRSSSSRVGPSLSRMPASLPKLSKEDILPKALHKTHTLMYLHRYHIQGDQVRCMAQPSQARPLILHPWVLKPKQITFQMNSHQLISRPLFMDMSIWPQTLIQQTVFMLCNMRQHGSRGNTSRLKASRTSPRI